MVLFPTRAEVLSDLVIVRIEVLRWKASSDDVALHRFLWQIFVDRSLQKLLHLFHLLEVEVVAPYRLGHKPACTALIFALNNGYDQLESMGVGEAVKKSTVLLKNKKGVKGNYLCLAFLCLGITLTVIIFAHRL